MVSRLTHSFVSSYQARSFFPIPSHDGVATACQAATQKSNSQKITSACVSIFGDTTTLNDTNGTHALIGDTNPLQSHGLTIVKTIAISPLTSRDIRVAASVTLSPLIEFACVLIGLAMAVPLAAVVWAVGP